MIKPIPYHELTPELSRRGVFVLDMPNEAYHAYEGISKSGLDVLDRSPAHLMYGAKREPSRAMAIGTAIHTAILEPKKFLTDYLLLKDVKARTASEYKQAIKVHHPDNVLIASEAANVAGMQESVYAQPQAAYALNLPGYRELSAFVEDPETGVLMRCRFDLITESGHSIDLKKTRDSRPEEFAKSVYNYRYHVQDAMYSHIFELITGQPLNSFEFLAVEEQPPHCAMMFKLTEESKQIGFSEYRRNLETYSECLNSNEWPGYEETTEELSLPSWAISRYEDELEII